MISTDMKPLSLTYVAAGWIGVLLAPLLAGAFQPAAGQPASDRYETGHFLFQNYTSSDYGQQVSPQNWSVTQDERGLIYAANSNGVLQYDGVSWQLIETNKRTLTRTVLSDSSGTVYVGARGEIGYLAPDSLGQMQYVSLLQHLPPERRDFGHTWDGEVTSEGVYFRTDHLLFRWDGTDMQHWAAASDKGFARSFAVRDTFYVQEAGEGLKRVIGDSLELVPGGEQFADINLTTLLPLQKNAFLAGTLGGQLFRYDGQTLTRFGAKAQPFLREHEIYNGLALPGNRYALATLGGGVLLMDAQGRTVNVLNKTAGLVGNEVKSLFLDRQGGLWLACETGLARVEASSPLSVLDERNGLKGAVFAVRRHDGQLYAGTSQGVHRLVRRSRADGTVSMQFESISGIRGQTWALRSTEAGLLAAAESGVFVIRKGRARHLTGTGGAMTLHRSQRDSARMYVGYANGLGTIRLQQGAWHKATTLDEFDEEIHLLHEMGDTLWAASPYTGLWRIEVPEGLTPSSPVMHLAPEDGYPRHVYRKADLNRGVRFFTDSEMLRLDTSGSGRLMLRRDTVLHAALGHPERVMAGYQGRGGRMWFFTQDAFVRLTPHADGSFAIHKPFARVPDWSVWTAYVEKDGTAWVGGKDGLLRYDPRRDTAPPTDSTFQAQIRRVATIDTDSVITGDATSSATASPELAYADNALRFQLSLPRFDAPEENQYRFQLVGFDDDWSDWTSETRKDYTNLPEGTYHFRVQGRDAHERVSKAATYAFTVLPPWYRTSWAYALYLVLAGLGVYGLIKARSRYLERRNRALEATVSQRTAQLRERNEELHAQKETIETQAKRLEALNEELRQTNVALWKESDAKEELMSIAAHDLKNPITGIRELARILSEENGRGDKHEHMSQLIYESAQEALDLIDDLLGSTAAETGTVPLNEEQINVSALARQVVKKFKLSAQRKGQQLHLRTPENKPCETKGDPERLREVMSNLISNAIKYSPHDSSIRISVRRTREEIRFAVQDEGPGLTEEDKQDLFKPHQRLSNEPTGGEDSSGLGLYIVKKLVDLHDGRVWVDSTPGEGSTFAFALPARPPGRRAQSLSSGSPRRNQPESA